MALTDTDLREVLAQRAAVGPADSAVARVAAVDRRVRVIRRRRVATASLAVVVVLLAVTGLSGVFRGARDRAVPLPAHLQKVAGGMLPRYTGGAQATAYTTFRTDDKRETTFTFTPTSFDFLVGTVCDKAMPASEMVSFEINGKPLMWGSCGRGLSTAGTSSSEERARAEELGVRLGEPSTVRVHIVHIVKGNVAKGWTASPERLPVYRGAMGNYRVAVAVYSRMPITDYPFPPRPHKLLSLDDSAVHSDGRLLGSVDARSVGPTGNGEVTTTLTAKGVRVDVNAVAPGGVTVTVDGQSVETYSSWAWTGEAFGGQVLTPAALRRLGVEVKAGDRISVGIAGERFTDPGWLAQVYEGS